VVFRHACKLGFEGIVSKRLGSPYVSGNENVFADKVIALRELVQFLGVLQAGLCKCNKRLATPRIIGGAALLIAAPFSLQWSQKSVPLSLDSAEARIGRPLTATSVAGVSRRAYRRAVYGTAVTEWGGFRAGYRPDYISSLGEHSYYLPPYSYASSYNYR
jgi:hypothetical protein